MYMLCKLLLFVYRLILIITLTPHCSSYLLYEFGFFLVMASGKGHNSDRRRAVYMINCYYQSLNYKHTFEVFYTV